MPVTYYERKTPSTGTLTRRFVLNTVISTVYLCTTCPVHAPWVELTKEHDMKWEPIWQDKYTGPQGGPPSGPTQFIVDIVRSEKGLADIFFAILPLAFFERVAQLTTKYCYNDWVVQRRKKYSDGNDMKQFCYVQVSPLTDGSLTPNRRHRADNKQLRYSITSGFIIASPQAQADYVANNNAVDRNDWDSADFSTTIRTNQYYLRIFCWALDRVTHA